MCFYLTKVIRESGYHVIQDWFKSTIRSNGLRFWVRSGSGFWVARIWFGFGACNSQLITDRSFRLVLGLGYLFLLVPWFVVVNCALVYAFHQFVEETLC